MSNENNDDVSKINESIQKMQQALAKFGLDIITKIGQQTMKLNMVNDKLGELNEVTLSFKSLIPQLNNIVQNQKNIESELDLIKSLVQRGPTGTKLESNIEKDETVIDTKNSIAQNLTVIQNQVDKTDDPKELISNLENIKSFIFETTGGHRVLYEISQVIKKISNEEFDLSLKTDIKEKIGFWINKL